MRSFAVTLVTGAQVQFKCPIKGVLVSAYLRTGRGIITSDPAQTMASVETATDAFVSNLVAYLASSSFPVTGLTFPVAMGQVLYLTATAGNTFCLMIAD